MQWTPPQSPVLVHGGEVRLEQVLVNLVTNAADAMQDSAEKHLEITVEPRAPVIVRVRDTGPGIESPERIFDPFYSTKQVGSSEGMGLGLSISYGLVQSFGGNIRGANTGSGAEFSVELEPWTRDSAA
ncbi:MAG: ATP-binding protein [Roseovarius sp.]|nr:ATP-binding protein [Roseovarius sp.]